MDGKIKIRDARGDERGAIEVLVMEAYAEYVPQLPPDVWKLWSDSIHETIGADDGELIVAEDGEGLVGAIKFFPDVSPLTLVDWPEGAASMRILSVKPGARGNGVGRMLIGECVERAMRVGSSGLYILTTAHMNAARNLYSRMGFVPFHDYDGSAFLPEERIEAYYFKL